MFEFHFVLRGVQLFCLEFLKFSHLVQIDVSFLIRISSKYLVSYSGVFKRFGSNVFDFVLYTLPCVKFPNCVKETQSCFGFSISLSAHCSDPDSPIPRFPEKLKYLSNRSTVKIRSKSIYFMFYVV